MRWWRICPEPVALDKACTASADNGGHWNEKGVAAMYAGRTVELCALEKFVHLNGSGDESNLVLVAIDVPDERQLGMAAEVGMLPADWGNMPASRGAVEFGTRFLRSRTHLYLQVPSVIVPEACVIVINPAHPAYDQVRLQVVRPFAFDPRMFKR